MEACRRRCRVTCWQARRAMFRCMVPAQLLREGSLPASVYSAGREAATKEGLKVVPSEVLLTFTLIQYYVERTAVPPPGRCIMNLPGSEPCTRLSFFFSPIQTSCPVKPQHQYDLLLLEPLSRDKVPVDTFALERNHHVVKTQANELDNILCNYGRAVFVDVLHAQLAAKPASFAPRQLVDPTATSRELAAVICKKQWTVPQAENRYSCQGSTDSKNYLWLSSKHALLVRGFCRTQS